MIGRLKGKAIVYSQEAIIIDVNGVGYIVNCPKNVVSNTTSEAEVELWIEMDVKQDSIQLYGFPTLDEKRWFILLQSVQGVGAKVALNILSSYPVNILISLIIKGDKASFQKISGIGPKLAQRIVIELSDKLPNHLASTSTQPTVSNAIDASNPMHEAISALTNLGFNRLSASETIHTICASNPNLSLEELIRAGLKALKG